MSNKEAKVEEKKEEQFLYVLEARPGTLRNSANYLKNRGWKIHSTTKVKEFLGLVMGSQPQLVMICIDHPNPTVGNLSRLIANAFPSTKVIAFVDGGSSASLTKLKTSKNEYTVYPPLSGPAIERVILRVLKDLQKAAETPVTDENGNIVADGEKSGADGAVVIKGRGATGGMSEQARNMLAQFMSSDDSNDTSSDGAYHAAGSNSAMGEGGFAGGFGSSNGGAVGGMGMGGSGDRPQNSQPRRSSIIGGRRSLSKRARPPKMDFSPAGGWQLREYTPDNAANSDPNAGGGSDSYSRSKDAPVFEYDDVARKLKGVPKFTQADASLIIKATDNALDQTVIKGKATQVAEKLSTTTSVACIAIESVKFTGYLVAALGKNRKIDDKFIAAIRSRLVEFMKAAGEDFSADDAMDLDLQQVEFEGWALKQAEFLRKTIHNGQEIAMAFFPEKINRAPLEISASQNMLKLDIEELLGNATMEFDLYVHLPTNNKYVLYTRQDQKLHSEQLDRLKTKGVQSMHLRKEDETNVRRYRVRNFLNDKIKEHQDETPAPVENANRVA